MLWISSLMSGWPVQDIATRLFYSIDLETYQSLRAAFQRGYTCQSTWPERRLGEKDSFIAARGLGLANFILTDPDPRWKLQAAEFVKGIEIRLRRLLER